MRVIRADRLDSLADYRMIEVPAPSPEPGQVRVRVAASGIGYVDALLALGRYQVKPQLPYVPGIEAAGTVDAVGAGVTRVREGDRVLAAVQGGFAEQLVVPEADVIAIPDAMSFPQAAGFRINYLTALHGLRDRARLASGEHLLVIGAGGGVGVAATQIGRLLGANVIASASSAEKRRFALDNGAHAVLDSSAEDWRDRLKAALQGAGLDVVFDPVCGPLLQPAFRSLSWRGRHLVVGFAGGPIQALPVNLPLLKGAALLGVDVRQFQLYERGLAWRHLAEMLGWVAAGDLVPPVGAVYPFSAFGAALEFALSGRGIGKTVLEITG